MSEYGEESLPPLTEPASLRYNKGPLAAKIDELIASIMMRSGFGTVIIRIVDHRVKEAEEQATYRL